MAIYEYRCPQCGVFEIALAMGSASRSHGCVHCENEARRFFSIPHLTRSPTALHTAIERVEKSRDEPELVTQVPARKNQRPQPPDARIKRLPARRSNIHRPTRPA